MKVSNPVIQTINSTSQEKFNLAPDTFLNLKFIIFNNVVNNTITIYDAQGTQLSQFTVQQSTEISFKAVRFGSITFSDPNSYNIIEVIQYIKAENEEEHKMLKAESDVSLVPINDIVIVSPLDANGNVKVSVENAPYGVNVNSPLDTNGNVKTSVQAPLPFRSSVNANAISQSLATANTAQALSGTAYNFVIIYNPNSDTIKIGNSSAQNIPIASGGFLTIDVHEAPLNLASIYWVSATAGDTIQVMYA